MTCIKKSTDADDNTRKNCNKTKIQPEMTSLTTTTLQVRYYILAIAKKKFVRNINMMRVENYYEEKTL